MTFPYNYINVKKQTLPSYTCKRQYTSENIMQFKLRLSIVDWSDVYNEVGADDKYNCFFKIVDELQNECSSLVKYKLNAKHLSKPWITPSMLRSVKKKNRLYSRTLKTKLEVHKTEYKIYKNKLTKIIRVAEKEYYGSNLLEMQDTTFKLVRYSIFDIRISTIVLSEFKRLWTFFLGKKLEHF